jgi:DNA polymerase
VFFEDARAGQPSLFEGCPGGAAVPADTKAPAVRVPPELMAIAERVAAHRDEDRWVLLYRVTWRVLYENRGLLEVASDPDVIALSAMDSAVRRDLHKMHAFVRFRRISGADGERYVAYYKPDHRIVRLASPFFAERFASLRFSILTPDDSAHWDGEELVYGPGARASDAPQGDELEELFRTYYRSTYNPARARIRAMKAEMPVRYWSTLPETLAISDLVREGEARVAEMLRKQAPEVSPIDAFLPPPADRSLPMLREAAAGCRGCSLFERATQTVFGEGPEDARAVLVGEQPGDREDIEGRPFVGPAGELLDEVLREVGLPRSELYVTNAVKHFKYQMDPRGPRRIHQKPAYGEIRACSSWLRHEVAAIKPDAIVCLGASAAQSFMGSGFRMARSRGQAFEGTPFAPWWMATHHPAAILRTPGAADRARARRELAEDLQQLARRVAKTG